MTTEEGWAGGTIRWVRYGRDALDALRAVVAETKADDAMSPVTIIVPNNIAGIVARRRLAEGLAQGRPGVAAVRLLTVRHVAEELAGPALANSGRRPASSALTALAVRASLSAEPGAFAAVANHPATARALVRAYRSLRDVDDSTVTVMSGASTLTSDVARLCRSTRTRLSDRFYDTTDLLVAAARVLRDGTATTDAFGTVVVYLPQDMDRAEHDLLHAVVASSETVHLVVALTGDTRADSAVQSLVPDELGPGTRHEPVAARVLTASDSDDEVRCVVREVVDALRTTPAHRLAVLYSSAAPYARLLHEHLSAAGVTVNGAGVRPVAERATARLLLGLLETARTGFRRADVLRTIGEAPVALFSGERVSVSRFERASREAGVVGGPDWQSKLGTYAASLEREAESAEYESTRRRAERGAEAAQQLSRFVTELQERVEAMAQATTWTKVAQHAGTLLADLLPEDRRQRLPLEEQYALGVVDRALAGLSTLDSQHLPPSLLALEEVLAVELESALPRVGRFGEGVLVAPLSQSVGLDLDAAWVMGLSEDLCPGRLHEDSLLPEKVRDLSGGQLPSIRAAIDTTHRQLLAAFAAAPAVTASFPRGDLRRSTERLPSRWLLPSLRYLAGDPELAATRWQEGVEASADWLTTSPSFAASVLTTSTPSTRQEWTLRDAMSTHRSDDVVIEGTRELRRSRRSDAFTRFDGNLTGAEDLPHYADGKRAVSPTSLERYAICPHAWFVQRLLHVEPVESPEERLRISAMDVGNILHEAFDRLVSASADAGTLPGYGQPWTAAQREHLQQMGAETADRYADEGKVGHPRLWTGERARILRTLARMMDDDDQWRADLDARVVASELAFGGEGAEPVRVALPDGGSVSFRGSADKVDETRDGTILVTDIKTGSARTFMALRSDPVAGGKKLQLPVYALAARAAHGHPDTPVETLYWFVHKDHDRVILKLTPELDSRFAFTIGTLVTGIAEGAFPPRAPEGPDFRWVQCAYCNPDGLGHNEVREAWERKRLSPELAAFTALVDDVVALDPTQTAVEEGR